MAATLNKKTMDALVREHLYTKGSITAVEAQAVYRCRSLSRRIATLRQAGLPIISIHSVDKLGQRYVRYELVKQEG